MNVFRYYITKDNVLVMASEVGVYDVDPEDVVKKGRLRPGRMLLVDMEKKCIIQDEEMKRTISESRPHDKWWKEHLTLRDFVSISTCYITVTILIQDYSIQQF